MVIYNWIMKIQLSLYISFDIKSVTSHTPCVPWNICKIYQDLVTYLSKKSYIFRYYD
jgi:hypothetical protein